MKIAFAAEITPARTLIPILEKLNADIVGLTHGNGVKEILEPYCSEIYCIGHGRGLNAQKRSNFHIGYLVMKDIIQTVQAIRGKGIELLITCGNAGDVRKGLVAANLLKIPTLHIEQDIYNPIEMIAFANLVTTPSQQYKEYLHSQYALKNVKNIQGYPMASFVNKMELMDEKRVQDLYDVDDFILVVLGGDLKSENLLKLIKQLEKVEVPVLIAPFRFDKNYVKSLTVSPNIKVLDGFVDLPSIMNASKSLIYGAGMGITIEAGVLGVPSIKLEGFHHKHASIELARELGILVAPIDNFVSQLNYLKTPNAQKILKNSKLSIKTLINIIENFDTNTNSKGGYNSLKKIWDARSKFR